jgi:acetyl-CoA carboxylase carboxyltransferase component
MTWQEEINEIKLRKELAKKMGGPERIAKQHSKGRLTIRERIDLLLDKNSFREIGSLVGNAEYDNDGKLKSFTHAPQVMGYGKINGRLVTLSGGDITSFRGGNVSLMGQFNFWVEKLSLEWRIPTIRLLDSFGESVSGIETSGRTICPGNPDSFALQIRLLGQIPVASAALGSLAGGLPVMAALSHFSVMTKETSEGFVGGPPLVKQALGISISKEELGNYKVHTYQSGVIDNVAEDESDAFAQIKVFLSYMPQNVWQQPPRIETGDDPNRRDEELLSIIPKDRRKQYDIRQLIRHIVDRDSAFELSPFYGRSLVTLLARIDGYPIAMISNDCKWDGGAQTSASCEKMMRFCDLADTFHLPIVYLVDCPGFMVGLEAEKDGIERKSARMISVLKQLTVPGITIMLRRCFGIAGEMTVTSKPGLRYAWPSGHWNRLPLEGGVMAAYRKQIEDTPDPEAKRIEIEKKLEHYYSPFLTAEAFGVEEIIDPRDTRPLLVDFVRQAQEITSHQLGIKYRLAIRP